MLSNPSISNQLGERSPLLRQSKPFSNSPPSARKLCNKNAIQQSIKKFFFLSSVLQLHHVQVTIPHQSPSPTFSSRSSRKHSSPARFIIFFLRSTNANWRHFLHFLRAKFLRFWFLFSLWSSSALVYCSHPVVKKRNKKASTRECFSQKKCHE